MAKNDEEFGKWKSTTLINGKLSIKQFETGFALKTKGELVVNRIDYKRKTTHKDVVEILNKYYEK